MIRFSALTMIAGLLTACAQHASPPSMTAHAPTVSTPSGASQEGAAGAEPLTTGHTLPAIDFGAHGLSEAGCFLLRDLSSGQEQVSSVERCEQARRPNSTFKIVNALIGADLGLLSGPETVMKWDAARYPKQSFWFDGWAQDQPLREAMKISAVPLFQKLAFDIGPERMAAYLKTLDYGNRDMSGGPDRFWLEGSLRITASQQVNLISKLVRDELPVSKKAQAIVREVLRKDPIAGAPHAGKTGSGDLETLKPASGSSGRRSAGWSVGSTLPAGRSRTPCGWRARPTSRCGTNVR